MSRNPLDKGVAMEDDPSDQDAHGTKNGKCLTRHSKTEMVATSSFERLLRLKTAGIEAIMGKLTRMMGVR